MKASKYTLLLSVGLLMLASCQRGPNDRGWEFAPNMYRSVAYEPLREYNGEKNKNNPQGLNMRLPVRGTVVRITNNSRNETTFTQQKSFFNADPNVYSNIPKDSIEMAERTLVSPIEKNDITLADGKLLYEQICSACHGLNGKGNGTVAGLYKGVPNYSSDAYKNMNDGHIFHTITHGKGRMWPHGSQVSPEERWKIVLYVHELQQAP